MRRLDVYRQKQFKKRLIFFLVIIVLLVIFLTTIGFNFVIKSSVFLGQLGNKNQNQNTTDTFFGTLDVDTPPVATNSAQMILSGTVSGFDEVTISINDKTVKTLHNPTSFSERIGDLTKGQNQIGVLASLSKRKTENKEEKFLVLYKSDKPKLDISEPTDGTKTNNQDLKVAGKTDPDVMVQVNSAPVVVDVQGNFQTYVKLQEGDNKLTVTATDTAGNVETKELTVHYEKQN